MVGDNAKSQTGQFKCLVKMNSILFEKELFVVGCYHYILNIVVRQSCRAAFGSTVWKEIIKMSSSPMIQVERSFLAEFLELLIISALEYS